MKILAIETSCDETAVTVLDVSGGSKKTKIKILSSIVASQAKIHAKWGGVVPNLAKREHQKNLPIILRRALKQAKISEKKPDIDLIAVTSGPGLEPALWVGINFAQELAKKWQKPLIGINHLEGHIFSVFLQKNREISNLNPDARRGRGSDRKRRRFQISKIKFPILALIVSGGHTELVLIKKWLKYRVIGQTLDDAAGEAFDKVARLLGLGYPGGPAISQCAAKWNFQFPIPQRTRGPSGTFRVFNFQIKLPRPMINSKDYNFSFSGLKTAVLYLLKDLKQNSNYSLLVTRYGLLQSICAEFQQAVIDVLIKKTIRAAKEYKVKTIILGGGVAANEKLRHQLQETAHNCSSKYMLNLLMPEMRFAGDNAAMIALAAYFRKIKQKKPIITRALKANGNLKLA